MAISIHIEFKGVGSKEDVPKNKDVTWELNKTIPGQPAVNKGRGTTPTTADGELIIDHVDLQDDETLQLKYTIGQQTGAIPIKHNADSKLGKPIVIKHWLSLTFKVQFTDSGNHNEAIKGREVRWQLEKQVFGQRPAVVQGETVDTTDLNGKLIKDIEITEQESFQLKFTIESQSGSVLLKHDNVTKNGNALELARAIRLTAVAPRAAAAAAITNPQRHWLTYESLFNKKRFKKPKCEFKLGLYLIPINDVTIWVRDDIPPNQLRTFVNAFFPDFEPEHIRDLAKSFWWWKNDLNFDFWVIQESQQENSGLCSNAFIFSPRTTVGNRDQMIRYLEPYAVLPYNRFDNGETSKALATTNPDGNLLRIRDEDPYLWSAWKTASRSCVVRLPAAPTKAKGILWKTNSADSIARNYEPWSYDGTHRGPAVDTLQNNPYDLKARMDDLDVSLKTGVEYVGEDFQGGGNHKDVIGDWLIGCLRSDYITQVNKELKPPQDGLLILTELITITEKKSRQLPPPKPMKYKEGIQVRDISLLNKNMFYLAPLNIPFVSLDLKEFKSEFYFLDDRTAAGVSERDKWSAFWKKAFASALGRAKALFLLRYGLQILNPNQQNFLIEFKESGADIEPTGNIVIRDLNDASIHREVVWALFDGPGLPPQDKDGWKEMAQLKPKSLQFEFEEGRMAKEGFDNQDIQETGTTNEQFGPPGTQFLWQRFSSFGNVTKPASGVGENLPLFKNLLTTMADWGMAHNKSYISCVEAHLGINFRKIDWSKCPYPFRHQRLISTIKKAEDELKPQVLEKSPSTQGLEISGFSFAKLSDTQKSELDAKITASTYPEDFRQEKCLQIIGTGFADDSIVMLGKTVITAKFIIGKPDLLVVCPKVVEIKGVVSRETGITVTDPGTKSIVYHRYVYDPTYISEMEWEEMSAKVIHDFLASQEGQHALKKCKTTWQEIQPAFTIRFTKSTDGQPFAWKRVFMKTAQQEWTDLTNGDGEVRVFSGKPPEFQICPQIDENMATPSEWLSCLSQTWQEIEIKVS